MHKPPNNGLLPFARRYARASGRAVITAGRALARANQRLEQTLRWGASAPLALLNRAPVGLCKLDLVEFAFDPIVPHYNSSAHVASEVQRRPSGRNRVSSRAIGSCLTPPRSVSHLTSSH